MGPMERRVISTLTGVISRVISTFIAVISNY